MVRLGPGRPVLGSLTSLVFTDQITNIIARQITQKVRILTVQTVTTTTVGKPLKLMRETWTKFEMFQEGEFDQAPEGVDKWFHSRGLWWWANIYDAMAETGV